MWHLMCDVQQALFDNDNNNNDESNNSNNNLFTIVREIEKWF